MSSTLLPENKQKQKVFLLIIFMEPSQPSNLKTVKLQMSQTTQLQQIIEYLKQKQKFPFKNCLFTARPAEKAQFTLQKSIKDIKNQCKFSNGSYVLLCYESNVIDMSQQRSQRMTIKSNNLSNTQRFSKKQDQFSMLPSIKTETNLPRGNNLKNDINKTQNNKKATPQKSKGKNKKHSNNQKSKEKDNCGIY